MTKTPTPKATETASPEVENFPLSLNEFCSDLSKTDRRVEMIGAFHASEKAAKRSKDTKAAYLARYEAFCNAPA